MCESLRAEHLPRQRGEILAEASPALLHSSSSVSPPSAVRAARKLLDKGVQKSALGHNSDFHSKDHGFQWHAQCPRNSPAPPPYLPMCCTNNNNINNIIVKCMDGNQLSGDQPY